MTPEIEKYLEEASKLINSTDLKDVEKAKAMFFNLLQMDRTNHGILFCVGSCFMRLGQTALAEHLFRRCLEMEPKFAEAWNNLGFVIQQDLRREEAATCFNKALEIQPEQTEFYNNIATGYVNNGTPDQAIEWAEKALEKDSTNSDAKWNMGLAYLEKMDWEKGWECYEEGLHFTIHSSQRRKVRHYVEENKVPYWNGETDGPIAIYGEQGVGDEILGYSMLEEFSKTHDILYEAHPRLVSIARHSFNQAFPIYGTRKVPWRELPWVKWQEVKYKLPLLSLGRHLRKRNEDFPREVYLKPFDHLVDKHRARLNKISSKPKIGISWKGGTDITNRDYRSIPLNDWKEILECVDADWISLQYDPADRQGWNTPIVQQFEEKTKIQLHHDPEVVNDLDECYAGLIHALDLVISVNTSLVHACGAFGVPCWVLTPNRHAWRYASPDNGMIWYGSHVEQFFQENDDWAPVVERLKGRLQSYIDERTAA